MKKMGKILFLNYLVGGIITRKFNPEDCKSRSTKSIFEHTITYSLVVPIGVLHGAEAGMDIAEAVVSSVGKRLLSVIF